MDETIAGMKVAAVLLRGGFLVFLAVAGWQDYRHRRIKISVLAGFGVYGGVLRGLVLILGNRLRTQAAGEGAADGIAWPLTGGGGAEAGAWPLTGGGGAEAGAWPLIEIGGAEAGMWPLAWHSLADMGTAVAIGGFLLVLSAVTREAMGKGDGWFFVVSGIYLGFWRNLALLWGSLLLCLIIGGVTLVLSITDKKKTAANLRKLALPFLTIAAPVGLGVLLL